MSVEVRASGAVVLKQVLPKYPDAMRHRGIEGIVELDIVVDAAGMVVGITTVSATNGTFVTPARNAVWTWEFAISEQMLPDEQVRYRVPIEFRLGSG